MGTKIRPAAAESRFAQAFAGPSLIRGVLLVAFLGLLLKTAWVCDDAFITFRVLDNFIHGYGLRWNVAERVWAFTNPLWLFAFAPLYAVTREAFFSSIAFSMAVSLLVFWLLVRNGRSGSAAVLCGALLLGSKAFVEFSTSGLENPLAHLLLIGFFLLLLQAEYSPKRIALLSLLAALAILNRPDAALLYAPALGWVLFRQRSRRTFAAMLIGFSPLLLWEFFALLYYGFPFPNTAYAKLGGIPFGFAVRLRQGADYFLNSLAWDPLTLVTIAAGVVLACWRRGLPQRLLAAGILLHLGYVFLSGGDFMSGRFFSVPFVGAVLIAGGYAAGLRPWQAAVPCLLALVLAGVSPLSPLRASSDYGAVTAPPPLMRQIADERRIYFPDCSLLQIRKTRRLPSSPLAEQGRELRAAASGNRLYPQSSIVGMLGYFAGPNVHVIDRVALGDAFLVRMPPSRIGAFRPGHMPHQIPEEYIANLQAGRNLIKNPAAARLFDAIKRVTRDPVFGWARLREIVRFNCDAWLPTIEELKRDYGDARTVFYHTDLSNLSSEGRAWALDLIRMGPEGITVNFGAVRHAARLDASLTTDCVFRFTFLRGGASLASLEVTVPAQTGSNLKRVGFPIPEGLRAEGFDQLRIVPVRGGGPCGIGHLRLLDEGPSSKQN